MQVAASAGAAQVGQAFSVEALVTQQTVDPNGVVQQAGVPSVSVQLSTDPSVTIAGANPGTTGSDGPGHLDADLPVAGHASRPT